MANERASYGPGGKAAFEERHAKAIKRQEARMAAKKTATSAVTGAAVGATVPLLKTPTGDLSIKKF
jgi:hypothetical protein